MDSRERTFLALDFQAPDRVPLDLWMSRGFRTKVQEGWGLSANALLDAWDVDLRYISGPEYIGPPLSRFPDGTQEDLCGVQRQRVLVQAAGGTEAYEEVAVSPLAEAQSVVEVEDYARWPSPDWFDYGGIEAQCEAVRQQGRVAVFMGDRLNRLAQLKPAMYLRGVERIFQDLTLEPGIARAIIGRIRLFYLGYAERIFAAARGKLDLLLMGDDFGSQQSLLLSPRMWADFLQEGFAAYIALAHGHGVRVMHHTCGAVRPLVPLMADSGLDVLQSLQPEAAGMDLRELKVAFGQRLAFHGGISIQQTLPFGTPQAVRQEVRDRIEVLAPGGGYILGTAHDIQADTPLENLRALLEAHREFGTYR